MLCIIHLNTYFAFLKINVRWDPPCENGSPLTGFDLDFQPAPENTELPIRVPAFYVQHLVENLQPDTVYRYK